MIGERSLNISDKVDFKRHVSQTIRSTPFVELKDGRYTLTAKVRNGGGFSKFEMYAETNGKTLTCNIKENTSWTSITIDTIAVKDGTIEVDFVAESSANAYCYIDDIALVKSR